MSTGKLFGIIKASDSPPPPVAQIRYTREKGLLILHPKKEVLNNLVGSLLERKEPGAACRLLDMCRNQDRVEALQDLLVHVNKVAALGAGLRVDLNPLGAREYRQLRRCLKQTTAWQASNGQWKGLASLVCKCDRPLQVMVLANLLLKELLNFPRVVAGLVANCPEPVMLDFKQVCRSAVAMAQYSPDPHSMLLMLARTCKFLARADLRGLFWNKGADVKPLIQRACRQLYSEKLISYSDAKEIAEELGLELALEPGPEDYGFKDLEQPLPQVIVDALKLSDREQCFNALHGLVAKCVELPRGSLKRFEFEDGIDKAIFMLHLKGTLSRTDQEELQRMRLALHSNEE